ncbi:MAG: TIGR04255 family protein [Pseudomonadota bacterium]
MIKSHKAIKKDPLISSIVEILFSNNFPTHEVFPGYLFSKLPGSNKSIHQLPGAFSVAPELTPQAQHMPMTRLEWNQYHINFSKHSIMISHEMGQAGWDGCKSVIAEVIKALKDIEINAGIERYSVKNVYFFPNTPLEATKINTSKLNINIQLADFNLEKEVFHLRTELSLDDFIHIIQIASSASIQLNDKAKKGIIVDVDTLRVLSGLGAHHLLEELDQHLNRLHSANKNIFLKTLKTKTIQEFNLETTEE